MAETLVKKITKNIVFPGVFVGQGCLRLSDIALDDLFVALKIHFIKISEGFN